MADAIIEAKEGEINVDAPAENAEAEEAEEAEIEDAEAPAEEVEEN